ncbi:MAG: hypothetical protein ACRDAV_08905, partial [Plesiomonas shigelloides]
SLTSFLSSFLLYCSVIRSTPNERVSLYGIFGGRCGQNPTAFSFFSLRGIKTEVSISILTCLL